MQLLASDWVVSKLLQVHGVTLLEVEEAFFSHGDKYILDDRRIHRAHPPTVWFIGETLEGRLLKVVIIPLEKEHIAILRSAYEPNEQDMRIYEQTR